MASLSAPITALRQRFSGRKRSGLAGELDPAIPRCSCSNWVTACVNAAKASI